MIDGWRQKTSFNAVDLALDLQRTGIAAVIHTDIDRFVGNPEGNLALTTELGRQLSIPVISSGTVDTADDLARLTYLHNIGGVILGRALLNERLDLGTALRLAAQSANSESSDELPRVVAPSVAHRGVRVYLSAYSSTQPARWWNSQLRAAITEDNPSIEVSIPQEDLEIEYEQEQPEPGSEQSRYLEALQQADVVVVGLDGIENEAWSGFECGFAKACGKPLIGLESTTGDGGAPSRGSASLVHACDEVIHYEQYEDVKHTIDCLGKAVSKRLLYPDSQGRIDVGRTRSKRAHQPERTAQTTRRLVARARRTRPGGMQNRLETIELPRQDEVSNRWVN